MAFHSHFPSKAEFRHIFRSILAPEAPYYRAAILLSAFISMLTLAVPISIQMLIDQVANTGLVYPVIVLAVTLFVLLAVSGFFYALRAYILELFERRIFARLGGEITLKVLAAPTAFFDHARRDDLMNRYFDIMVVKKTLPHLLVGLFSFFFQAGIGFVVTSLYHPLFLVFNGLIILVLYIIWRVWGWRATETAFRVSEAKYDVAAWIEGLTHQADLFKSGPHGDHALRKANRLISTHIEEMRRHFRLTFTQLIILLTLYAAASASLLGLGGWLVIIEQLTLGQLVAAELILSAIFASFALLGGYLKDYYDLAASCEELSRIGKIPGSPLFDKSAQPTGGGHVVLKAARMQDGGADLAISLDVKANTRVKIDCPQTSARRMLTRLLKGHIAPISGAAEVDGTDVRDWHPHHLHDEVVVIDRPTLPQMTIREFMSLARADSAHADMHGALECVGLLERITALPGGIETVIAPSGWPLTSEEALRLKLASAILDRPRVLVLADLFDQVDTQHVNAAVAAMAGIRNMSAISMGQKDLDGFVVQSLDVRQGETDVPQGENG